MPPILALLLSALGQLGIDPRDLLNKGVREGLLIIRQRLESHWLKSVDDIAEEMRDQGWKLDSTSPEARPHHRITWGESSTSSGTGRFRAGRRATGCATGTTGR
jgi:hypothetical protein